MIVQLKRKTVQDLVAVWVEGVVVVAVADLDEVVVGGADLYVTNVRVMDT